MLNTLKRLAGWDIVNLKKRFEVEQRFAFTPTGTISVVREEKTSLKYFLKIKDEAKTLKYRERFKGLDLPEEIEIVDKIQAHVRSTHMHGILPVAETGVAKSGRAFILYPYFNSVGLPDAVIRAEKSNVPSPPKNRRVQLVAQLAKAVQSVNESGFICRGISPQSIICSRDWESLNLFDFSLTVPDTSKFRQPLHRVGSPIYTAPEVMRRKGVSIQSDVFSLGVVAFEILTDVHPWGLKDNSAREALIFSSKEPTDIRELIPKIPDSLANAVMKCLHLDPAKRHRNAKNFLIGAGLKTMPRSSDAA